MLALSVQGPLVPGLLHRSLVSRYPQVCYRRSGGHSLVARRNPRSYLLTSIIQLVSYSTVQLPRRDLVAEQVKLALRVHQPADYMLHLAVTYITAGVI